MLRYLRLYASFVRFSFSRAMEFRLDFFFRIVMDLIYYGVNIAFYRLIFLHTRILGGWTEAQMMVFVAGYLVIDAVNMTVIGNNLWWFPQYVNRGDLDYYLVRPVSALFFVSLRDFAANSFVNLVMAVGILVWALAAYPAPTPPAKVALFVLLLLNGSFLYYLIRMVTLIPVFWIHSARGLGDLFWPLTRFAERPDRIFTGWFRRVLLTVLPFSLMASFPARVLLDIFDWRVVAHCFAVSAALFCATLAVWRAGLRSYSSASS